MRILARRGIAVPIVLAALGVLAVAGYRVVRLPDPATADRSGLIRWIVARDLSQEDPAIRLTLARRFEREFQGEVNLDAAKTRLNPQQQERVWNNVVQLLATWLLDKVDGYGQLPKGEQTAYLDATIDTVRQWKSLGSLRTDAADEPSSDGKLGLLPQLMQRIDEVQQASGGERQQQVRQFVRSLQMRWLQRSLLGTTSTAARGGQAAR